MDSLHSGLIKKKEDETTIKNAQIDSGQKEVYLGLQKQVLGKWQENKGLGDADNLEDGVKTLDFAEESIHIKFANTTFSERSEYYFHNADYMQSKVLRYRSLANDDNGDVKDYADKHTNRSLKKRKDAAASAANHFEKAMKLEEKLNQKDQNDMDPKDLYKARNAIMRERMEGMISAARVKANSKEDEEFRIAKAKLTCLTILKEQSGYLRDKQSEAYFDEIDEKLTKEIEKERKTLSKSTSKVNSKWMDSLGCNDKESLERELRESGNEHATIEDVKIARLFQSMSAEREREEYVNAKELANKNKTFDTAITDRKDSLLAPAYLIRRDKNGKPINKEEMRKEQWNKKWLEVCSDPEKSYEKKLMIRESFERFKRMQLPDPKELKEKGTTWFLKKDPVTFYTIFNALRFDNLIKDESFARELCDFDIEFREKLDACMNLSNIFSLELRVNHRINDGVKTGNDFKILDSETTNGLLEDKEEFEFSQSDSLSKYEKCYPSLMAVKKKAAEIKRDNPAPKMVESYDEALKSGQKIGNNAFTEKSYEMYKLVSGATAELECPDYKIIFADIKEKLKKESAVSHIAAFDVSRMCGAMLRHVNFNNNWEPVSKEDMEAHEWNMRYLTNLRIYHLGAHEAVESKNEEAKKKATDDLVKMFEEEYKSSFTRDDLLPKPEILKKEILEPLKKGEPMNSPFMEEIIRNQKKMHEFFKMGNKTLSMKETAMIIPGGDKFYEAHQEYSLFGDLFGSFAAQFMQAYTSMKYGFVLDASGATTGMKFKADAATMEAYISYYETLYNDYQKARENVKNNSNNKENQGN